MDKPASKSLTVRGSTIELIGRIVMLIGAAMIGEESIKQEQIAVSAPGLVTVLVGIAGQAIGSLLSKIGLRRAIGKAVLPTEK